MSVKKLTLLFVPFWPYGHSSPLDFFLKALLFSQWLNLHPCLIGVVAFCRVTENNFNCSRIWIEY